MKSLYGIGDRSSVHVGRVLRRSTSRPLGRFHFKNVKHCWNNCMFIFNTQHSHIYVHITTVVLITVSNIKYKQLLHKSKELITLKTVIFLEIHHLLTYFDHTIYIVHLLLSVSRKQCRLLFIIMLKIFCSHFFFFIPTTKNADDFKQLYSAHAHAK